MRTFKIALFTLFIGFTLVAFSQRPDASSYVGELPLDTSIMYGQLDNGVTYYIKRNMKPENRAELRLVVNAGSILEDEDQQGLAHFCEHMLFNGTENFDKNELIDFFELSGVKFGPHLNAYTSFDETVYMIRARTDDKEIWDKSWQVLEDWAHQASFDSIEIEKERGVVLEEWRLRLGPDERMRRQYWPVMFKDSRYAERLPIGKEDVISNCEHDALKRYYREWYRTDLMAVIAVGDFDKKSVHKKIEAHFGNLEPANKPRERAFYEVPDHHDVLAVMATDHEAANTFVTVYHLHPRKELKTIADFRWDLMRDIYNQILSMRFEEIRKQEDPPFVFAGSNYRGQVRTKDVYASYAMVPEDGVMRGLQTVLMENQRFLRHGFSPMEFERAKAEVLRQLETAHNDRDKEDSRKYASQYVRHYLTSSPVTGIEYAYRLAKTMINTIEIYEVFELSKQWLTEDNVVIVVTGPQKDEVTYPTPEVLVSAFRESLTADVEPYMEHPGALHLIRLESEGSPVVSETTIKEIGVTEWRLGNGARVILKPTDFKNDEILFSAQSFGGSSLYPDSDYESASNASQIVGESGLGMMSGTDLQKFLMGKVVRLGSSIGDISEGLSGSCSPQDFEVLLQMAYLHFTAPRRDEAAFSSLTTRYKMMFRNMLQNPNYYYMSEVAKLSTNNHPRTKMIPEDEDIDAINLDRALEIYRERFADAGDFTFFFVGNFTLDGIKPLVEKYIGSIPDLPRQETWKDIGVKHPKGTVSKELKKGSEPKSSVTLKYFVPFEWDRDNRLKATMLSEVVRIKLREALREEKGGVYGVGVYASPQRWPKERMTITISFGCSPDNVEDLIETALAEIEKIKTSGPEDKDLLKVKETSVRSRETDLKENRFWLNALSQYYFHSEDPKSLLDYDKRVKAMTGKQLQAAAKQWFSEENFLRVVMNPEQLANN